MPYESEAGAMLSFVRTPSAEMRPVALLAAAFALTSACAADASAQSYPVRPVRVIVPLAPGGGNDTLARFMAKPLSEALGQQLVVENRPGGGGLVGGEFVARSAPDGYTLVVAGSGLLVVTLAAVLLPARRAALVDPIVALRNE